MFHDEIPSNRSGNRPFHDVLRANMSRRSVLARGLTLSAAGFAAAVAGNKALVQTAVAATGQSSDLIPQGAGTTLGQSSGLLDFMPVSLADFANAPEPGKQPVISEDYEYQVLIPWGTPLDPNGPIQPYDGDPVNRPTSAEQAEMVGIGHDGMWLFPINGSNDHGVLCINHEFGTNFHVLGKDDPSNLEEVRRSQHAHGVSVVEIRNINGAWQPVTSNASRRIHVNTPVEFSGPVAGSDLIDTPAGNAPAGTVNNCSNGYTPWGTYLTCEENFNGYFGSTEGETFVGTEAQQRYGFDFDGFGYSWHLFDARFDLSNPDYKNEENRFGWVVEIDPMDKAQTPMKRTALGRFKHEGVAVTVGRDGRIICYMGDDQRYDYIYKYESAAGWRSMLQRGISPLDQGTLYVARFNDDNTGEWLELSIHNPALRNQFSPDGEIRFDTQEKIMTYTRLAADILGATPMDRPEWTTIAPDGKVYCSLTNNSQRDLGDPIIRNGQNINVTDAANPLAPNDDGHIIYWTETGVTTFDWDIFVIAQDTHGTEESFSDPDGLWADPNGRLFIETDGGQKDGLQDQLLVADTNTGEIRRLLVGVGSDEITGLTVTPDRRTLFCNTQHPGNGDPAVTNFPAATDGVTIPRDSTFVITRKNGGIVGS